MEALLSSWLDRRDRRALHEMGLLLDEALDARSALQENASTLRLDRIPIPEWEEVVEAAVLERLLQARHLHESHGIVRE